MASISLFFSLLCIFSYFYHTQSSSISPFSLTLHVTKDHSTLQYITTLSHGTPLVPTKLVLDLGGPILWLDCANTNTPSSSLLTIPHRSIQCLTAKTLASNPSTQGHSCQILSQNSITGTTTSEAKLVDDIIAVDLLHTRNFLFSCSPTLLLNGLATLTKGMIGLGRSRTSFASQLFDSFTTDRKITLCLSSSSGVVSFGRRRRSMVMKQNPYETQILKSLTFTPLIKNPSSYSGNGYFINVNTIKINGKKVSLHTPSSSVGSLVTELSSVVPYTTMRSSIYSKFERAYLKAAMANNMTRVSSVEPFGVCFRSVDDDDDKVPVIDLVLQSEMVKWRIYGRNSMVKVSDEVMCLGVLDGGEGEKKNNYSSIVIGGYQLEDVLLQFDFDSSMVGFSSSLLMRHTSCSDFKSGESISVN